VAISYTLANTTRLPRQEARNDLLLNLDGGKRNVSEDLRFAIIEGIELSVTEIRARLDGILRFAQDDSLLYGII